MLLNIGVSLITSIIGGLLTGWLFNRLAGKQLRREAEQLREINLMILNGLEAGRLVTINRDSNGNPIGFSIVGSAAITLPPISFMGTGTVTNPPTPEHEA